MMSAFSTLPLCDVTVPGSPSFGSKYRSRGETMLSCWLKRSMPPSARTAAQRIFALPDEPAGLITADSSDVGNKVDPFLMKATGGRGRKPNRQDLIAASGTTKDDPFLEVTP